MAVTNAQRVQLALQVVARGLGPYVDARLARAHGADWPQHVAHSVPRNAKEDPHFLLTALIRTWREAGFQDALGHSGRSWVGELLAARNAWAHNEAFSGDQAYRTIDTAKLLLDAIGAGELGAQLDPLRQDLLRTRFSEEERRVRRRTAGKPTEGAPAAGLRPWREIVTPHPDVASGQYAQAEFAADLHQVWRGDATAEYGDPTEFFRRTFLTEGLRTLLVNAVRRLGGQGGNPVIELQTNFGGGKTHSLIALLHLTAGLPAAQLPGVEQMLAAEDLAAPPAVARAVLVGQKLAPSGIGRKGDGTEVRTIWGELAWQLGGAEAYASVAEADRTGTNPGEALIHLVRAHSPCLILVDEWVAYARQLYGVDGLAAGSFDAQFSFAQTLTDAAREVPGALLVVSIPASDIEVGGEGGRQALTRLHNVVGRMEASWQPATTDEGFEIVRRRLFEGVTADLARERDAVVHRFAELYRAQKAEFPAECSEAAYERRLRASYPIHPELFDRLYGEWSTLERFQRTRGVLRLMASVVYELWRRDDRSLLILPGTLPVEAPEVTSELMNYLDQAWRPVIDTDVDGPNALPLRLDNENPTFGRYSAARRVARTIFFGSAPVQEAANRGLDDRRVKLGCVQPGEAPATFGDALRRLANQALYLSTDGQRSWYGLQQTVTRLAEDRAAQLAEEDVDEEVRRRLRADRQAGDFARVHAAPGGPADVDDEAAARLVVLGPERAHSAKVQRSAALELAEEILGQRAGGPRTHRNMLVFLAPDVARIEELRDAVRRWLAWTSIDRERESLNLDTVQRSQTGARCGEWDQAVDQRIGEAYSWLLVPAADAGSAAICWEISRAAGSDPLAVRASRRLRSEEALITAYSGARLRLDLDRVPLWRGTDITVRELWSFYTQYLYLPRLRDVRVLLDAVADGVALMTWRQDGFAYADAVDEEASRYIGLRAGEHVLLSDPVGHIVQPSIADAQLQAERLEAAAPDAAPSGPDTLTDDEATASDTPAGADVLRRFHGSVELDPMRMTRDASEVAEAVVAHLNGLLGASVRVTLEIDAELPDGVPEDIVRTVTENAGVLRFDEGSGFETS